MDIHLPGILVTGASGFVGRNFLDVVTGKYRLFCIARQSQKEAGVPKDENTRWAQVDIANWETLREVKHCIKRNGGAEYVLHLAGYYDFTNAPNQEYERTNVFGTRNVLTLTKEIRAKRFIFASSLAACKFPSAGEALDEQSAPDADFPYAWSKRFGEDMMKEYAEFFSISIIRVAAVFSDWCEYPPLYMLLKTWLSKAWNARILAGQGESAVPYIHINDLIKLFLRVIEKSDRLPQFAVFNASPNHTTSHLDLFFASTRYYYGEEIKPVRMPRIFVAPGLFFRQFFGRLFGHPSFEKLWMVKYIDKKLNVDATKTQEELGWNPASRNDLTRRLLILVKNMKNYGNVWHLRNEAALKRVTKRPNLIVYEALVILKDEFIKESEAFLLLPQNQNRLCDYHKMDPNVLKWFLALLFEVVATGVRTNDRMFIRNYAQIIAYRRYQEGFNCDQVCDFLTSMGKIIMLLLLVKAELKDMKQYVYDYIDLSFQLAVDEVESTFEGLESCSTEILEKVKRFDFLTGSGDLERIVQQFTDFCQEDMENQLKSEFRS